MADLTRDLGGGGRCPRLGRAAESQRHAAQLQPGLHAADQLHHGAVRGVPRDGVRLADRVLGVGVAASVHFDLPWPGVVGDCESETQTWRCMQVSSAIGNNWYLAVWHIFYF